MQGAIIEVRMPRAATESRSTDNLARIVDARGLSNGVAQERIQIMDPGAVEQEAVERCIAVRAGAGGADHLAQAVHPVHYRPAAPQRPEIGDGIINGTSPSCSGTSSQCEAAAESYQEPDSRPGFAENGCSLGETPPGFLHGPLFSVA